MQRIVTKVQAPKSIQQQQKLLTPTSPILQQQPTQIIQAQVQSQQTVQQQQQPQIQSQITQQPQTIRVLSGTTAISNAQQISTGTGTPIRVLSSTGQQVRIATQQQLSNVSTANIQHVTGQQTATVLRGQNIVGTQLQQQRIVSASGSTTTTATIGGKQIILQKPLTIVGGAGGNAAAGMNNSVNQPQIVTLVKTSQGMTVQTLPKVNVLQKGTGGIQTQQQIVTSNILGGSGTMQHATVGGQKTAVIGGNVVKLMSSTGTIGGKQILMKNPNIVQVGKVGTNVAGKPTLVITNKAGQQIRSNQQVIVVTTPQGIRTVSGTVTSSANNFVSLSTSQVINTLSTSRATSIGGATTVLQAGTAGGAAGQAIKLRAVQGGKPITFTVPVGGLQAGGQKISGHQIINMQQKGLTIGGKAVTVQLAPSAGGQKTVTIVPSSGGATMSGVSGGGASGQQKIVMLPTKTATRIVTQQQFQQIQLQQQQLQQQQLQQQQLQQQQQQEQVSTDAAFAALAAEAGLIENEGDQIDQMDGCFDLWHGEEASEEAEEMDCARIEEMETGECESSSWPTIPQIDGCNDIFFTDEEEGADVDSRDDAPSATPRFVRLGLFGGAAAIENQNPEGGDSHDGDEQDAMGEGDLAADADSVAIAVAETDESDLQQAEGGVGELMEQDQEESTSEEPMAADEGVPPALLISDQEQQPQQQLLALASGDGLTPINSSEPAQQGAEESNLTHSANDTSDASMQDASMTSTGGEDDQLGKKALAETANNVS